MLIQAFACSFQSHILKSDCAAFDPKWKRPRSSVLPVELCVINPVKKVTSRGYTSIEFKGFKELYEYFIVENMNSQIQKGLNLTIAFGLGIVVL